MRHGDVQLRLSVLKPACVVDPGLLLARADGPALAQRLSRVFEVWLPRSFWMAVEACEVWPEVPVGDDPAVLVPDPQALRQWQLWRDTTDAAAWTLRWVDDCVARSQTHSDVHEMDGNDLLGRYDHLGAHLEQRLARTDRGPAQSRAQVGLPPGLRHDLLSQDSAILSAVLEGALVLCEMTDGAAPWPVRVLQEAGLSVAETPWSGAATDLLSCERQWMRESLVAAGLAPWARRLPTLAVLHVLPGANLSCALPHDTASLGELAEFTAPLHDDRPAQDPLTRADGTLADDPWREVSACWYRL